MTGPTRPQYHHNHLNLRLFASFHRGGLIAGFHMNNNPAKQVSSPHSLPVGYTFACSIVLYSLPPFPTRKVLSLVALSYNGGER